jgi:ribosomal protein L4
MGERLNWVGAEAPGTVGGRVAHPPKASRIWEQKVNVKENRKAIRSAIAATISTELVKRRGHRIPKEFPFILDSKVESVSKTKDVARLIEKLGFAEELGRTEKRKIRAGKGKNRGRKYSRKIGPLFVVGGECPLLKAAKNIPGADAVIVQHLNAELLAPGCHPGRLTFWTEHAIDALAQQQLYTEEYKGQTQAIKEEKKEESKKKQKQTSAPKREEKPIQKKIESPKKEVKQEEKKTQVKKEHAEVENIMKELKAKAIKKV